jgi:galactokinase/mevalonate kinase-like predicted kinase
MAGPEFVARTVVPARAALAGNPSDGYGGAVLAVAFEDFCARAEARTSAQGEIRPPNELVKATVARFARELEPTAARAAVRWRTSIPRSVGLGGSSAIVLATLRALCALHWIPLTADELAGFALAVETEELGIAAGLQDRIAQSYGGLTFMDFSSGRYEPLAAELLPPLVIAWHADAGQDSGPVHNDLRQRFERGERDVLRSISELTVAARVAREALLSGERQEFARAVDASFDARARMLELDRRHVQMIQLARAGGAAANYAGSGGAIVAVCRDRPHQWTVHELLREAGCGAIVPTIGRTAALSAR